MSNVTKVVFWRLDSFGPDFTCLIGSTARVQGVDKELGYGQQCRGDRPLVSAGS